MSMPLYLTSLFFESSHARMELIMKYERTLSDIAELNRQAYYSHHHGVDGAITVHTDKAMEWVDPRTILFLIQHFLETSNLTDADLVEEVEDDEGQSEPEAVVDEIP